jgi:RHS repeat-associated protein
LYQKTRLDSSGTRVTWYMHPDNAGGLGFEAEVAPSGTVSLRHYLNAGDVGIVHMNGRLFDPTLGVFMQPDAHVQNATDLQNFNRYGYCLNNPSLLVKRRLGASESCWCMLRHHQRPDPISS